MNTFGRYGCTATITGNAVVVMGGLDEKNRVLSSVECFSFDWFCWEELPQMTEPRSFATSVGKTTF